MKIAIRADGGNSIGMGHIMRTLSLAKVLRKKHDVYYVCSYNVNFVAGIKKIEEEGFKVIVIKNELEPLKLIAADLFVVDKYNLDMNYFKSIKEYFGKVMYIDDFNIQSPDIDIILNQNIGADESKYMPNQKCKLLLGPKYAMLRKEFVNQQPVEVNECTKNVMITMGGADPVEFTKIILEFAKAYENLKFHVVVGAAFKDKQYYDKLNYTNIIIYNNPIMIDLMRKSDVAISAAGSTLYEFCKMGVPTLSVIIADNQEDIAERFSEIGVIRTLGWFDKITFDSFSNEFNKVINDFELRKKLSREMNILVDGNGCNRVSEEIDKTL